jgi:hypothetical protein
VFQPNAQAGGYMVDGDLNKTVLVRGGGKAEDSESVKRRPIGIGIFGGGLMGREIASAFAR